VMFGHRRTPKALGHYPQVSLSHARKKALSYLGGTVERLCSALQTRPLGQVLANDAHARSTTRRT
jgi:hypothetical protein